MNCKDALLGELVDVLLNHLIRSIIKKDVHAAHGIDCLIHRLLAVLPLAQVRGEQVALATVRLDQLLGLLGVLLLVGQIRDQGISTLLGEEYGRCAADARVAAGDDGALALELAGGLVLLVPALVIGKEVIVRLGGQLVLLAREVLVGDGRLEACFDVSKLFRGGPMEMQGAYRTETCRSCWWL